MEPDCALELPAGLGGRQGERLRVPLTLGADVTAVRVAVSGTRSDAVEGESLRLTVPYGTTLGTVVLESTCDGKTTQHDVNLTVQPLRWTRAAEWTGAGGPSGREYFATWLDAEHDRVLLYGGFVYQPQQFTPNHELWAYSLSDARWSQLPLSGDAPASAAGRVVPQPGGGALYFGGLDDALSATPYVLKQLTVDEASARWSADFPAATGRGEYQPSFFYDARRDRYLSVCGGSDGVDGMYHCEVRELRLTGGVATWAPVAVEGLAPGGRNGHAWAYDEATDRLVLFGGDRGGSTLGDTWVLDLSSAVPKWTCLFERSEAAQRRRNMGYVLDTRAHRLLVWGGTPDGATAVEGVQALDLTPGAEQWYQVDAENAPPARTSAGGVYDAERNRALLGFGNSALGIYVDWWALEL